MPISLGSVAKAVLPWRRGKPGGFSTTPTYRPAAPNFRQPMPSGFDHLLDVSQWSRVMPVNQIMSLLVDMDPDVSAAVHAYLTVADTQPVFTIKDIDGAYHNEAYDVLHQMMMLLTYNLNFKEGFNPSPTFRSLCEDMRYMVLLRGGIGAELVTDEKFIPREIRLVDMASLRWYERKPGRLTPEQWPRGAAHPIDLDIATFFTASYRNNPTSAYSTSPFVAAINTIAARTQVINDLYRIQQMTGWPRLDVTVLETVLLNSAPPLVKADKAKSREWVEARMAEIRAAFGSIKPDEAFVHTDATTVKMVNEKNPANGIDMSEVIKVLNAQNQAGLKTVSTILGRGESGVNTASVESRVFSMHADAINGPVAEILSKLLTCAYQMMGYPVFVEVAFRKAELRPALELEPQLVMRQSRLMDALSRGLITDIEFHMEMFGRPPAPGARELSGTNFLNRVEPTNVSDVSPNSDPLGRSLAPEGSQNVRSNRTGGPGSAQSKAKK